MMRPETVKHICSEWCSIDEKGWKIFVVKKKVEVSMSSFILRVVKHTLILHTLCQVWNKLWSFILYVVEKNLEDIFKIFFLEEFFSCKTKKMKMLLLVSGSINSSKTNVRVVQVWILKPAVWLIFFSKIACKILVPQNRYWSHSNRKTWFSTKVLQNFFLFILYVVEKYLEDIFKKFYLEEFFSSKMKKTKMLHLEVSVKINHLEDMISWGFGQDKLSSRSIIFKMQNLEERWYSRCKISNIWVLYTS